MRVFVLLSAFLASAFAISSLDFIRSSTESPHFYDASGRVRIFHGANRVAKSAPWFFPDMLSDGEADAMAELGFNVVRLGWMWSGYNKAGPGMFNETYFERQLAVVRKLASRGIHTLLDMHEDVLSSKFCLYDGAPLWVVNKSIPRHAFPWPLQGNCSSRGWMANTLTEAAGQAYQDLYDNTGGMLDDLAAFWARSARVWRDEPAIIGYEVMNEPFAGDVFKDPLLFLPGVAGRKNLMRMHDAVAKAIRAEDDRHMIFYEPVTWGMVLDGKVAGSGYDHVPGGKDFANRSAMSFHYYCASFCPNYQGHPIMRRAVCDAAVGPLVFKAVNADITRVGGSAMMTEGLSCDSTNESTVQECVTVMNDLDKNLFSWTDYGDSQGALWQPSELQRSVWARTYARAIAGKPLNMTFSSDTKAFELCYAIDTAIKAPTEVFTSLKYSYPAGASLRTTTNLVATPSGDVVSVMPTASAKAGDTGCIWISKL